MLSSLGLFLHNRLAPEERYGPTSLWIFEEEELAGIALPLGRIASRHVKLRPGVATDASDAIEAATAAAFYAVRNITAATRLLAGDTEPDDQVPPARDEDDRPLADVGAPAFP